MEVQTNQNKTVFLTVFLHSQLPRIPAAGTVATKLDVHAALLPTINILPWLNWGRAQACWKRWDRWGT